MYFKENVNPSELCKNVPEGVIPDQWHNLVYRWKSTKAQAASERNRRARAQRKTTHTTGTKSFARCAHEMKMSNPKKVEPHRALIYLATHKKDEEIAVRIFDQQGKLSYVCACAYLKYRTLYNNAILQIQLAIGKRMQEESESENNQEGRVGWEGDALDKVLGKDPNGRVRGLGLLPTSKNVIETSGRFRGLEVTTMDEKILVDLVHKYSICCLSTKH